MKGEWFTPAVSPESVGIPSRAIARYIERLEARHVTMHGLIFVKDGQVAAEGYWRPFQKEQKHRMYSVSKSFVSLAIGLLIDEGKLSLNDPVARFFPDKLPEDPHPYLTEATVRDLLMMATPHSENAYGVEDADWLRAFFHKQPSHPAGTIFSYDTAGTVVLTGIVERLSGRKLLDYLWEKLLGPIGCQSGMRCVETPEGGSWGGSGIQCTLGDMARVALCCLRHGRWEDRQLLCAAYVDQATARQIDNPGTGYEGYGYQIWRVREGFAFNGMGSQFAMCYPERDFLFACVADTQSDAPQNGMLIQEALYEEILPHLSPAPLPENPAERAALAAKLQTLRLPPQPGATTSAAALRAEGVWYALGDNPMGISRTRLCFEADAGVWEYEKAGQILRIPFGLGDYREGLFPEPYFGARIGTIEKRYRCLASAAWTESEKLHLRVFAFDDYFGGIQITFSFKGEEIAVWMSKVAEWFFDDYQGFAGGRRE